MKGSRKDYVWTHSLNLEVSGCLWPVQATKSAAQACRRTLLPLPQCQSPEMNMISSSQHLCLRHIFLPLKTFSLQASIPPFSSHLYGAKLLLSEIFPLLVPIQAQSCTNRLKQCYFCYLEYWQTPRYPILHIRLSSWQTTQGLSWPDTSTLPLSWPSMWASHSEVFPLTSCYHQISDKHVASSDNLLHCSITSPEECLSETWAILSIFVQGQTARNIKLWPKLVVSD